MKGLAGGFAVAKTLDFLGDTIAAASNLNETVAKTGQIFGSEATPALEEWAETASESFGQSKRQALDAAATFGIFGKSAGLGGDELTGFSTQLAELASDLASFNNSTPEEAITAIGAALRGESEPIRRYGVLLDDATLRQRALKLGIIETTSQALTPQQRVLAAQAEILEQTSDAQGDFARTSDELANTQRTNAAKWEDAMAKMGEALLPLATQVATFAGDVIPLLADGIGILTALAKPLSDAFRIVGEFMDALDRPLGALPAKVEDAAARLGITTEEMVRQVKENMDETGASFDEATANVDAALTAREKREKESTTALLGWAADQEEAYARAYTAVDEYATGFAGTIVEKMEEGRVQVVDIALRMPGDIAQALEDGRDAVTQAALALEDAVEDEIAPMDEAARLQAELTGDELEAGLKSKDPIVRARAAAYRQAIYDRLAQIQGEAYGFGSGVGVGFGNGLRDQQGYINDKAEQIKAGVSRILKFAGSPDYTHATEIGRNVGMAWGEGIGQALASTALTRSISGVTAALSPALPMGGGMAGVGVGAPGGQTIQYIMHVNGVPHEADSAEEAIALLQEMGVFSEGRV